jgi:ATP-dependent DNA ligase
MIIDLEDKSLSYSQRQALLGQLVKEISSEFITPLVKFKDFESGWNYVKETKGEGLVVRNEQNWFKVKILQEAKVEIKAHEESKEKGTFILIDNNRVSGTSKEFVRQFKEIKAQGKIPIAEIEYPFKTESGSYFQPRLRRIYTKGENE